MGNDKISQIIAERKQPAEGAQEENKFFLIVDGRNLQENFLELQFRNGLRSCFSYTDLIWFNFDPEAGRIDMEFGGFLISVKGRGLHPALFNGIKAKQAAWIKEADSEMEDHKGNENFVEEIKVTPPRDFEAKQEGDEAPQSDAK